MKILKTLLATIVLTVGFGCFCECPDIIGNYYNVLGLTDFKHFELESNETSYLADNDSIDFGDYKGLELAFDSEYTFGMNEQPSVPFHFSLMNTAYGTSCDCFYNGYNGSLQKVEAFDIITLNDFDSTHLANDTINEYFLTEYEISVDSFLVSNDSRLYGTWEQYGTEDDLRFRLFLNERPTLDDNFKVKVNIELDNGAIYTMESDKVIFK